MFLGQFGALSFGDALFASFVLLPLIQRQPVTFRKAVWGEHSDVLRALTIPISQVSLVAFTHYLANAYITGQAVVQC